MLSLDDLIAKHGLTAHAEAIRGLVRPSVVVRPTATSQAGLAPLDSRFGGLPHLPASMEWPSWRGNALAHIATIRLSEASQHDRSGLLPSRGLMYFWYDLVEGRWGFDPEDKGFCRVDYIENEDDPLILASLPASAAQLIEQTPFEGVFQPCHLKFEPGETLPNGEWIDENEPGCSAIGSLDEYDHLREELKELAGANHRLLGHADLVQGPWEEECQLVTNGLYCGDASGYKDRRAADLRSGAKDWRLLMQVDTDEEGPGWMWGDVGVLYFTIPEAGLRERRFDRSWMILQCC